MRERRASGDRKDGKGEIGGSLIIFEILAVAGAHWMLSLGLMNITQLHRPWLVMSDSEMGN